jgi:regulator of RNase E activity RraA
MASRSDDDVTTAAPTLPVDDDDRFAMIRKLLYTPVVGDVLDGLGRHHQVLPQPIQPLREDMVVVGRAMPVLIAKVFGPQTRPFGRLTEALDQLEPDEVYLACGGGVPCAAWGELLTVTARVRGAAGAVIDGYHRDTPKVRDQRWPVFSRGRYAQDAAVRASVIDYRVPVEIGQVLASPGDLVIGDLDGVVLVPRDIEDEVIERAVEKATTETRVRAAIEGGMSSTEAFATFGVL